MAPPDGDGTLAAGLGVLLLNANARGRHDRPGDDPTPGTPSTLLEMVRGHRVVFFGGKGGVGKTTLSSAAALALARTGHRVLVVSTDPAHNLGHLWGRPVGSGEVVLWSGPGGGSVTGTEIDPQEVAERHLAAVARTVRGMMPEHLHRDVDRYFDLARQSPGTQEAALLERMSTTALQGVERFDAVIFDTAPSGHTGRLLELPHLMGAWTDGLLRRRRRTEGLADAMRGLEPRRRGDTARSGQEARDVEIRRILERRQDLFSRMHALITDPDACAFVLVLTAERMPVLETVALHEQLQAVGIRVAGAMVNRRSPADAGALLAARRAAEDEHLALLRARLPGMAVLQAPLVDGEVTGVEAVGRFAELISAESGPCGDRGPDVPAG